MSLDFGIEAETVKEVGINLAKSVEPDFESARDHLHTAEGIVASSDDPLMVSIYTERIRNDLGVVDVREGLYVRSHASATTEEVLGHVRAGIEEFKLPTIRLWGILADQGPELGERGWVRAVHGHICGTMNTWFRSTQTAQLLAGDIGPGKKANKEVIAAQWMLGRGKPNEPGAWAHGRQGDNGYWSTQTAFLGGRAERINGGAVQVGKGMKWVLVRGIPEFCKRLLTDQSNRKQIVLTAGRLSLESMTRSGAIAAALDYRRFLKL